MKNKGFFIKGKDDFPIYLYVWDEVKHPRGVVEIFHGMAEHAGRYEEFASYLNTRGYIVYAPDLRGHGKTAGSKENLGNIGENGFENIVEDGHIINKMINEKHPDLSLILLGHSFGSFLTQDYISKYGDTIDAAILSGSARRKRLEAASGILFANIQKIFYKDTKRSKIMDRLVFGNYNKKIKKPTSESAWLSRDEEKVMEYERDEMCGGIFPLIFFKYFFKGIYELNSRSKLEEIPKVLPILIFSGSEDPVGGYSKLTRDLYNMYEDIGIKDVELKLYTNGRHEMLNETNRREVYEDIINWIEK